MTSRSSSIVVREASHDLVLISRAVIELAIEALAPAADFAGDVRVIGEGDDEIRAPHLRNIVWRRSREARRRLMEEIAANG